MGRIFERKGKKGSSWYIEYYYKGEQKREKVGRARDGITERMAKEALKSRQGDIAQDKFDLAKTKTYPLFRSFMVLYLDHSKTHKKSHERDATSSKHLVPFFGNKTINEINSFDVERYKQKRKAEIKEEKQGQDERDISFASVNRELALLKHLFSMAVKWGKTDNNPIKGIKMFPEKKRERYLEEHEITALLEACEKSKNKSLKVIVTTALNTGARLREVLSLKKKDMDFKNSIITFEHTKNGDRGKVPMTDYLKGVLQEHIKIHDFDFVFCGKDGQQFKNIKEAFKNALKASRIEDFRFHDLRHTFASHLTMNGIEGRTLQELGRWKTPNMVMRYAHLSPKHKKTAIDTLGKLFQDKPKLSTNPIEVNFAQEVKHA